MATRVLLTVDTELTWGHYVPGGDWRTHVARSFDSGGVGVSHQLRRLQAHGLKACFFVDPMPALIYGLDPIRAMVEPIIAAGQEVQLHLHSVWADPGAPGGFELTCSDAARQRELIETARELLIGAGAPQPIAFRAGGYAANADTLRALASLGIRFDSSHNGSHHPDPSELPLDRRAIAPIDCEGVVEIPVTQVESGGGKLRHLQLCAVSIAELRAALRHAADHDHPVTTIVSHSFELATRDGLRPNRSLCSRFEALCRYLADHSSTLPTAHFADLGEIPLGRPAAPLPPRRLRSTGRMVEQLWSNLRYEHRL